jgi:hypothetical protein
MATVSAGSINLTANVSVESGHHVATQDTTRSHVSEWRKPVATNMANITYPENRATGTAQSYAQIVDIKQYFQDSNQYTETDYFDLIEQTVQSDSPTPAPVSFSPSATTSTQTFSVVFDFCDYMQRSGTITYEVDCENISSTATAELSCKNEGATSLSSIATDTRTTLTFTDSFDTNNTLNGFVEGNIKWKHNTGGIPNELIVHSVRARIACTGRTRVNSSEIVIEDFEIRENLGTSESDWAIRYTGFDRGTILGGNPSVYSFVSKLGIQTADLNNTTYNPVSPYEPTYGPQAIGVNKKLFPQIEPTDVVTTNPKMVYRASDTDITDSFLNYSNFNTQLGGAAAETQNFGMDLHISVPNQEDALTDIPQIVVHNHINTDAAIDVNNTANLDIELRYVHDPDSSLSTVTSTWTRGFLSGRLILNLPFLAQDIDLQKSFTLASTGFRIVSDLADIEPQVNVTADFLGGIQQLGASDLDVAFALDTDNTGLGVIIDGGTVNFSADFATSVAHVLFKQNAQIDLDIEATVTPFKPRMIRGDTVNLQWNITQSYDVTAVGVIIDNAETETFRFGLTVVPLVFVRPDRYREFVLMPETRTYSMRTETRDYAVNTQTRSYQVPEQTRQIAVDTETRTITEKGYNS